MLIHIYRVKTNIKDIKPVTEFLLELGLKFETVSILIRIIITFILIIIFHLVKKSICSFVNKSNFDSKDIIKYKKTSSLSINILSAILIIPIWMYEY